MFFDLADEGRGLELSAVDGGRVVIGYVSMSEMEEVCSLLGFSSSALGELEEDSENFRSAIDVFDDYSCGTLNIIDANDVMGNRDRVGFFIRKNLFLVVDIEDIDNSTRNTLMTLKTRLKTPMVTLERAIYTFFERLLYSDNKALERMEFRMSELEEEVTTGEPSPEFNNRLLKMKKELLLLRNYYEQLIDIGEELQENENDLFVEEDLRYFKLFTEKARRLSENVQLLRETLVQLREAYDSSIDLKLNSVMKVFTVITTIFLPLTLIAGWYGMNFDNMPELHWRYGYIFVILLSAIVVGVSFWFFKKKKWL